MSELETMVLGTILANQIVILNHLDGEKMTNKSNDILTALETSAMLMDALKKILGK